MYAFDPTPRAVVFVNSKNISDFKFTNKAICREDKRIDMYPPLDPSHVSLNQNPRPGVTPIRVDCISMKTAVRIWNHKRIDILKVDIEGEEYNMFSDSNFVKKMPKFGQLLIEIHPRKNSNNLVQNILVSGYTLIHRNQDTFGFVRNSRVEMRKSSAAYTRTLAIEKVLDPIVDLSRKYPNSWIFLQLLNAAYVDLTFNWICNIFSVKNLESVLSTTYFLATDRKSFESISRLGFHAIYFDINATMESLDYGSEQYYELMLTRTMLVNELLKKKVNLALIESDAYWTTSEVIEHINSIDADIISADNSVSQPSGGFLFFRPTESTLLFWGNITEQHQLLVSKGRSPNDLNNWGDEMKLLQKLWWKRIKDKDKIKLHLLNRDRFVSGEFYKHKKGSPFVIQNNWIDGNARKIERAKSVGHWLLDETQSRCQKPSITLHVLTFNRPDSLIRLLNSLNDALYPGLMKIDLHIHIDKYKKEKDILPYNLSIDRSQSFGWTHGDKNVHVRLKSMGIVGQWIDCWQPELNDGDNSIHIILEDDMVVSKFYAYWFLTAAEYFRNDLSVAAITGQKPQLRAYGNGSMSDVLNSSHKFIKYRLMASWSLAPVKAYWIAFRSWYYSVKDIKSYNPVIHGIKPSTFYQDHRKFRITDRMWSMHFVYFTHKLSLYTVYAWVENGTSTIAANFMESGLHYGGAGSIDNPLTQRKITLPYDFKTVESLGWDGLPESDAYVPSTKKCKFPSIESGKCVGRVMGCRGDINMLWSIGTKPLNWTGETNFSRFNVINAKNLTGVSALYIADPILFWDKESRIWYLFFEVLNNECQKGEIGVSVSMDNGVSFMYLGLVLAEREHLSWPFVFSANSKYYMMPTITAGTVAPYSVTLYEAVHWPSTWNKAEPLLVGLAGKPLDPAVIEYKKNSWLLIFTDEQSQKLQLYTSSSVLGQYKKHPSSNIYSLRHAGPMVSFTDGLIWAFYQSSKGVVARSIAEIDEEKFMYFRHQEILVTPPRAPGTAPWAVSGMHSFSLVYGDYLTGWVAATDGWVNDPSHKRWYCLKQKGFSNSECGYPDDITFESNELWW